MFQRDLNVLLPVFIDSSIGGAGGGAKIRRGTLILHCTDSVHFGGCKLEIRGIIIKKAPPFNKANLFEGGGDFLYSNNHKRFAGWLAFCEVLSYSVQVHPHN